MRVDCPKDTIKELQKICLDLVGEGHKDVGGKLQVLIGTMIGLPEITLQRQQGGINGNNYRVRLNGVYIGHFYGDSDDIACLLGKVI